MTVGVRTLPKEYIRMIDEMCELESIDKGTVLRRLIGSALKECSVKTAMGLYSEGKIYERKKRNEDLRAG